MYVIKHTDREEFILFSGGNTHKSPFWVNSADKATRFKFKSDAEITIKQFNIPYVTAVEKGA